MSPVKRPYDASRRQQQAAANRLRVLDAARARFLDQGYAETTIAHIAADADVAPQTVIKHFGNKPNLVKALFDVALVGDDEGGPLEARDHIVAIHREPDPVRKIERYAAALAGMLPRTAPLQLLLRQSGDAELIAVWENITDGRLAGMANLAANLHQGRHLRRGVTEETARDVLWLYSSPELYELLVIKRGWTGEQYAAHIVRATVAALLP